MSIIRKVAHALSCASSYVKTAQADLVGGREEANRVAKELFEKYGSAGVKAAYYDPTRPREGYSYTGFSWRAYDAALLEILRRHS